MMLIVLALIMLVLYFGWVSFSKQGTNKKKELVYMHGNNMDPDSDADMQEQYNYELEKDKDK